MDSELTQVLTELKKMNQRFDVLDQRFDKVDQRFDEVDQRFDGVDQRFDDVYKRFDGVEGRIERIEGDVFNLKLGQEDLKTMFKANQEAVEKTHAELVAFRNEANEKFDHLERQNKFFDRELQDVNLELANHNREIKKLKFERE